METPLILTAAKLIWPQDKIGMTSQLKREGCRAIGRMGGKQKNLDIVMEVLRVLAKHAKAKMNEQLTSRADLVLSLEVKRVEQEKVNDKRAMGMETALRNQRAALDLRLAALHSRKVDAEKNWAEVLRKRAAGEEDTSQEDARAEQGIGAPIR